MAKSVLAPKAPDTAVVRREHQQPQPAKQVWFEARWGNGEKFIATIKTDGHEPYVSVRSDAGGRLLDASAAMLTPLIDVLTAARDEMANPK